MSEGNPKKRIDRSIFYSLSWLAVALTFVMAAALTFHDIKGMRLWWVPIDVLFFIAIIWSLSVMWKRYTNIIHSIELFFDRINVNSIVNETLVQMATDIETLERKTHVECAELAGLDRLKDAEELRITNGVEIRDLRFNFTEFRKAAEVLGVRALFNDPRHYMIPKKTPAPRSSEEERDDGEAAPASA